MARGGMVVVGLVMGLAVVKVAAAAEPTVSRPAKTGWAHPSSAPADRLGCTHVSGSYNFTKNDFMSEGADEILKLGMRTLKLYLNKPQIHYKFNCEWPEFRELVSMADHPYYRAVFEKPFHAYILTTFAIAHDEGGDQWRDHFTDKQYADEVRQFHDLAVYFMRKYKGTGKTFVLANWEGDWAIRGSTDRSPKSDPTPRRIANMIRWFNARQEGVEQARKEVGESDVKVFNAAEVNLVDIAMQGRPSVTNDVLPHTHCDLYSYSAYDIISYARKDPAGGKVKFRAALDYIASKAPASAAFGEKNLYIGEFGWPEVRSEQDVDASTDQSLNVIRTTVETALEWGCPYVVYWQVYDNEVRVKDRRPTNDEVRGFYLVKPDGSHAATWDYFASLLAPAKAN